MKFNIIFLNKKCLELILGIIITIICLIAFTCFKNSKILSTFNVISENKLIQKDLNGDGIKDILYIKAENNKYYLQINLKDKSLQLEPNKNLNSLGYHYDYWPMRITLKDVSRDNVPEIFLQSSEKGSAIQHIFILNGDNFEDILSSHGNLLGFFHTKNNQTPKIVNGTYSNGNIHLQNYMIIKKKLIHFNYDYPKDFMGTQTISTFINSLEILGKEELKSLQALFCKNIDYNEADKLMELKSFNSIYKFQDAIFEDVKCDKDGNETVVKWLLNFKCIDKDNQNKNFTINVFLKKELDEKSKEKTFKIYSTEIKTIK